MARKPQEQPVQRGALVGVERLEDFLLEPLHELAEARELPLALGGEADEVAAAVVRIAAALDQAALLEAVEQAHELAAIDPERVRDRRLRLTCPLVEQGQDAVVVGVEAG